MEEVTVQVVSEEEESEQEVQGLQAPPNQEVPVHGQQAPRIQEVMVQGQQAPRIQEITVQGQQAPRIQEVTVQGQQAPLNQEVSIHGQQAPRIHEVTVQGQQTPPNQDVPKQQVHIQGQQALPIHEVPKEKNLRKENKKNEGMKAKPVSRILEVPWRRGTMLGPDPEELEAEKQMRKEMGWWRIPPLMFLPTVGKATLTAYRSRGGIIRERWRLVAARKFLIHPYSNFRKYWLLSTAILTVFNIFIIPFGASFYNEETLLGSPWLGFSVICDIVFLVDLILNFYTAYMIDNIQSLDTRQIKLKYLKTWFCLDLLGLIPLDYIITIKYLQSPSTDFNDPDTLKKFDVSRVLSLLRLFRVSRLVRYANYLEKVEDWNKWGLTGFMTLIYSFLIMIAFWHWSSCFQFLIQKITGFKEESWVREMQALDTYVDHQYMCSLFRTLSHMLSVGYGTNAMPQGVAEIWLTIVSLMTGSVLYISILSKITAIVFGSYGCKRMYKSKYEQCELYLAYRRVPNELQARILNHLYIRYQGKWFDEEEILKEMSESLRQEVMYHNCHHIVTQIPWLNDTNIINAVIKELKFEVFQSQDVIFRMGAIGRKMYMIDAGVISLEDADSTSVISDGAYFGDACLFGVTKRIASATAITACRLYSLSVESFKNVLDQYPRLKDDIQP
ncbi:potassium/sodium hyperpolarization-activated cyclic nucleotide-gated channel 4-like [Ambystoma mexicanum]|uniref:potassium/sodium hyperpolarization-activated cyclic nucleotide-gated channel 4-like n=1 Tax=Ambystoma mexicanum TaxID=8296 RepID=UPI0037E8A72B